jgi:DNA-binding NarL/FixJ family response regulator
MTQSPNARPQSGKSPYETPRQPAVAQVIVLTSDMMVSVQLEAPARAAGLAVRAVPALSALATAVEKEPPALVILDLADTSLPVGETLREIRRLAPRAVTLGFYPHVRAELGRTAESEGCTLVLPRSRFFLDIGGSIQAALNAAGSDRTGTQAGPTVRGGPGPGDTP